MEAPKEPYKQDAQDYSHATPAAEPISDSDASQIAGGVLRDGGDDDLDDLEVER